MRTTILAALATVARASTADAQFVGCWGAGKHTAGGFPQCGKSAVPIDLAYIVGIDSGDASMIAVDDGAVVRCRSAGDGALERFGHALILHMHCLLVGESKFVSSRTASFIPGVLPGVIGLPSHLSTREIL